MYAADDMVCHMRPQHPKCSASSLKRHDRLSRFQNPAIQLAGTADHVSKSDAEREFMTHVPVLCKEVVAFLTARCSRAAPCYLIDGTVGCGGHSKALLQASSSTFVTGLDRDKSALDRTAVVLAPWLQSDPPRAHLAHSNFAELSRFSREGGVHGVLLDVGVSSPQLDEAARGFSHQQDGPLDMRMDDTQQLTAADIVNGAHQHELESLLREYGEEPQWRRAAAAIVKARRTYRITTTQELADIVAPICKSRKSRPWKLGPHPATLVFQVNCMPDSKTSP